MSLNPYLFGKRPSSSDYAIYGQLTQLVGFDPTSSNIAHALSPRVIAWIDQMEDMSGIEVHQEDWINFEDVENNLSDLFQEIGKVYIPALLANANAIDAKEKIWKTNIDGTEWEQQSFPYQAKCLKWINDEFSALNEDDQKQITSFLEKTGCENLIVRSKND